VPYDSIITADGSNDPLIPEPVSTQIIQELPQESFVLANGGRVNMSTRTQRQPVLDVLPHAYWVSGDTGLKQTSAVDWANVNLIAEELAVIVPIPENYLMDAQVPIWNEVRPRLVEAIGRTLDAAALFGVNKPGSWPAAVAPSAVLAGNTVTAGTGTDLAQDVAKLGEMIAQDGFTVNGFASRPGLSWFLTGLRSAGDVSIPIYQPNLQAGSAPGGTLYGYPLREVTNGAWDPSQAELIAGDWTKLIIGLRQDITFKVFDQGVITNSEGEVVLNLMQQDSVALRVVMRVAYATANPVTSLNADEETRFPFGVLLPQGGGSS
jgi:HK97 family phage major capsid protein